jgi:putative MATE family efflux protein
MLGSAAQNIIVLSDNIFLYHYSTLDFAAVGLIGAFYLIVSSIGYGFSRGGQILIARRYGEMNYPEVGRYFQSIVAFELLMAIGVFLLIQYGAEIFFSSFIKSDEILERCLLYIYPRSYGVFFSFVGVSFVALYTGIARVKFIIYDTMLLTLSNIVLNYIFIFGAFGIEPMGIKGAGYASTSAEIIAFSAFVIYIIADKQNRLLHLLKVSSLHMRDIRESLSISVPLVFQSVLALGAYFYFFTLIENTGARNLEISNLIRNMYLILSIPAWGYAAGINTIVSNFIGNKKRQAVVPLVWKTSKLNVLSTAIISLPVLMFPEIFLLPFFGGENEFLIHEASGLLKMLFPILILFSIGTTYLNGLVGTGHTKVVLWIQAIVTVLYVVFCYYVIAVKDLNLYWAWSSEFVYWGLLLFISQIYFKSKRWHRKLF